METKIKIYIEYPSHDRIFIGTFISTETDLSAKLNQYTLHIDKKKILSYSTGHNLFTPCPGQSAAAVKQPCIDQHD